MKYTVRRPQTNVNVTPGSPLKEFALLAGGLLALIAGTYLLLGLAVNWLAPRISPEFEKKIAAPFLRSLDKTTEDAPEERYLQSLINTLQSRCAHLPYHFRVHVQKSSGINAMALPGGHIVVFKGLLDKLSSENELTFVLAHEMGHYAHRDHLRGLGRGLVLMALSALLLGPDSSLDNMLLATLNLSEMRFSRSQESLADTFALQSLNCVYGHVGGATDLFDKLPESMGPETVTHYFSSHPQNRQRIDDLQTLIRRNRYSVGPLKTLRP